MNREVEYIEKLLTEKMDKLQFDCISAARDKDLEKIIDIISRQNFNINQKFDGGHTLLYYAAIFNFPLAVTFLIDNGASLKSTSDDGMSVEEWIKLYGSDWVKHSTKGKYYEYAKAEIAQTAESLQKEIIDNCDESTFQRCLTAVRSDDLIFASEIICKNPKIIGTFFYKKYTFLYLAVIFDAPNVAAYLLSNGAYKNVCNLDGQKMCEWALNFGSERIASALNEEICVDTLKKKIRAKMQDKLTKVFSELLNKHGEKLQKRIDGYENSFDVNVECGGYSILSLAAIFDQTYLAEFLIDKEADGKSRWPNGTILFNWVIANGSKEMVSIFRKRKADKEKLITFQTTLSEIKEMIESLPLNTLDSPPGPDDSTNPKLKKCDPRTERCESHPSANKSSRNVHKNTQLEFIKYNLEQKAKSLSTQGKTELSVILEVILNGDIDNISEMIFSGVFDVNTLYEGYDLLHIAMMFNQVEISKFLIENGIGNVERPGSIPAKTWAQMYCSNEIINLFGK